MDNNSTGIALAPTLVISSPVKVIAEIEVKVSGPKSSVNVVNLINVGNIYIPLSVYLEGVYNAIQDAASNPSSLVSVSISLGGPTVQSEWTPQTWGEFREEHET